MAAGRFIPLLAAPGGQDEPLVFAVGAGTVVVHEGEAPDLDGAIFLGTLDGRPCWATAMEGDADGAALPLMALWGRVDDLTWTIAGRAVQLVEWERTHRYCGRCATPTEPAAGERARRCPSCGLLAFPRLAPAIITLVEREDGRALLARGRTFPIPMYSCLAGFVEPGETLEEAVHREVGEEVGIDIIDVRYWNSQPWPFPHSLMIGFQARYGGGDLVLDEAEIIDANWYAPDDLPPIPPGLSIARRLIDDWVERSSR
jgi:NAD+ diphosphatase